jgi:hypothetical protein
MRLGTQRDKNVIVSLIFILLSFPNPLHAHCTPRSASRHCGACGARGLGQSSHSPASGSLNPWVNLAKKQMIQVPAPDCCYLA